MPVDPCTRIAAAAADARIGVIRGAAIGFALVVAAAVLRAQLKGRGGTIGTACC